MRTAVLLLIAIAGLAWILLLRPDLGTSSPPRGDSKALQSPPHPAHLPAAIAHSNAARSPNALAFATLVEEGTIPKATIERFLKERGRTADNLSLAFIISRDLAYIEEALALDPHSITALYARIAVPPYPEDSRYVDTLRRLEPDNPLWCVAAAYDSSQSNNLSSVVDLLRTATTLGTLNDPQQFLLTAEETFRRDYLSASPIEAVRDSRFAGASSLGPHFNKISDYLLRETVAASTSSDPAAASSLLATNLALTQLRAQRSTLHDFARAVRTETHLLTLVGRLGIPSPSFDRSLAEYHASAQEDAILVEQLKSTRSTFLASASPEALSEFLHNRDTLGEVAALQLLLP